MYLSEFYQPLSEAYGIPNPAIAVEIGKKILQSKTFMDDDSRLYSFIHQYPHDYNAWWDTRKPADKIVNDMIFQVGFLDWCTVRFKYARGILLDELKHSDQSDGEMRVERSMKLSWQTANIIKPGVRLGIYWSLANPQPHEAASYGDEYIFIARVPDSSIDWFNTMRARMDYFYGDEESEVRLFEKAPLELERALFKRTEPAQHILPGRYFA